MTPMGYAWSVLKAGAWGTSHHQCEKCGNIITFEDIAGFDEDGPYCKECNDVHRWNVHTLTGDAEEESIQSLMNRLMAGEQLTTPELLRLQDDHDDDDDDEVMAREAARRWYGDGGVEQRRRNVVAAADAARTRTPTPMDWFDTFRMTRPDMVEHANNIQSELRRRGGFGQSPSERPDPNNRFVRHTRAEMLDGLEQMRTELERRGRPPLAITDEFGSGRPRSVGVRTQPEQPVRGNAQELMQMLMDGEPLTQDEIHVIKEGQENESD